MTEALVSIIIFMLAYNAFVTLALICSGRTVQVTIPHWFPKRRGDVG